MRIIVAPLLFCVACTSGLREIETTTDSDGGRTDAGHADAGHADEGLNDAGSTAGTFGRNAVNVSGRVLYDPAEMEWRGLDPQLDLTGACTNGSAAIAAADAGTLADGG